MNDKYKAQEEHFASLKLKYQATKYEDSSPSSLLYLILRKADLRMDMTELEYNWLREHELIETLDTIKQQVQVRTRFLAQLQGEFSKLKSQYQVPLSCTLGISGQLYVILCKLQSEDHLNDSDIQWLKENRLAHTASLAEKIGDFATLKAKYKETKYQDLSPDCPLYKILKQLDEKKRLNNSDVNWLKENELSETLAVFQQQEEAREAEFAQLKDKYQASKHSDSSLSSPLYPILQKLEANQSLNESEIDWLKQHELTETLDIVLEIEQKRHFAALKVKYKAAQYEDSSLSSHLYKVLKILDSENNLAEQDINFLKKRNLNETVAIAQNKYADSLKYKIESGKQLEESEITWLKDNGRENIITIAQEKHFAELKVKYRILDPRNELPLEPFYIIMQKLEREERLDPVLIVQLIENELLAPEGKIAIAYHRFEALFSEQEFKRSGEKWNLPNASSHWRKAEQPKQALKLTDNLNFDEIKENKLKSALLTTRGGAFRDIQNLDKAEDCAKQAIEYQPSSHHPYTLMGAICYERHEYLKGDYWFEKAIKRGASPGDQDAEIKRVVKNAKDENKRREVVEYLLEKDPVRYAWAKSYLKQPPNKSR